MSDRPSKEITPQHLRELADHVVQQVADCEHCDDAAMALLGYAALLDEPDQLYALLVKRGWAQHEADDIAQGRIPQEATGARWIPVSERLPESGVPVLAHITNSHGKTRRLRAQWIAKHTYELWDGDDMAGDYSEETDTTYTPEGWYETNEYEETHFHINDPVSHWTPLPPGPDQASAPHEPLAGWIAVTDRLPEWTEDRRAFVLVYSDSHDWQGTQFAVMRQSDFWDIDPEGDGEPGTDDARVVTHWRELRAPQTKSGEQT